MKQIIHKVFGTWAVTTYGLECLVTEYSIDKKRLSEGWIEHMSGKRINIFGNIIDFILAINYARKLFGVKYD